MPAIYARGSLRPAGGCASLCDARRGHADNVWRVSEALIGGKNQYANTVAIVEVRTARQSAARAIMCLNCMTHSSKEILPHSTFCALRKTRSCPLWREVTSKESDHEMPPRVEIPLLDRLLASPAVPVDAKLAAIESCRRQLAQIHRWDREQRVLDARLAEVAKRLKPARRTPERISSSG
jgi:hypothetical protein